MFNQLPTRQCELLAAVSGSRMDEETFEEFEDGSTTLMCEPMVTYSLTARMLAEERGAEGRAHEQIVDVLLSLCAEEVLNLRRMPHGSGFIFF